MIEILDGLAIGRTGFTLPTMAMWRLNRAANSMARGPRKKAVYVLKNAFVRMLYERGLYVKVTQEDQVKECWHTRAYNDGWDDYCEKCDNTGIYSRYPLYRFVFVVDGIPYVWHQPVEMVDWPVRLDFGKEKDWYGQARGYRYKKSTILEDAWTVWWCLLFHGYWSFPPLCLSFKLRLSPETFKPTWSRGHEFYGKPFSLYIPFLFVRFSGRGEGKDLEWWLSWPWVVEGQYTAWSPQWLEVAWRHGRFSVCSPVLRKLWRRFMDWLAGYEEEELPF